jgi:hypothetical protein
MLTALTAQTTDDAPIAYDVFNGDADGLCAVHQWRLAQPSDALLLTGTKRDIDLFRLLPAGRSLSVTAFDVSFDRNRDGVMQVLQDGGSVRYFDHHAARGLFEHPQLDAHIDQDAQVCTSLLVNRHLQGRYRAWAAVAAFGDNLPAVGQQLAGEIGCTGRESAALRQLGELLNYNAYGETVADLHLHPAELYKAMKGFDRPLDFVERSEQFQRLHEGFESDRSERQGLKTHWHNAQLAVYLLPAQAWARRMSGTLANELINQNPGQSIALLTPRTDGDYLISIRMAAANALRADVFCSRYPGGGGRLGAAGIDRLAPGELPAFITALANYLKGDS